MAAMNDNNHYHVPETRTVKADDKDDGKCDA